MRAKLAKAIRRSVYGDFVSGLAGRTYTHYRNVKGNVDYVLADRRRRAYQFLKKLARRRR